MRIVSVVTEAGLRAGVLEGDEVFVASELTVDAALREGTDIRATCGTWRLLDAVRLDVPIRPPVVLCSGQNYHDHLDEKATAVPDVPEFFLKAGQTIAELDAGHVRDRRVSTKLDYETELGVVIGRSGRHIAPQDALNHVAGYIVVNDLTARERQVKFTPSGDMFLDVGPSKNFDGATRLGAWITTAEAVPDPQQLAISTRVSGELRQSNTTANMIFPVHEVIAYLSMLLTLQPGCVIATGTPGGTGWGRDEELGGTKQTPPGCAAGRYLADGDTVVSSVEQVGELTFAIVPSGV